MKDILKTKLARRITGAVLALSLFFGLYQVCWFDKTNENFVGTFIMVLVVAVIEYVCIKIFSIE